MRAYLHRCVVAGSMFAALALPACVTHDDGANPVCDCGGEDSNVDTGGDTADTSDTGDTGADTGADTGTDTAAR